MSSSDYSFLDDGYSSILEDYIECLELGANVEELLFGHVTDGCCALLDDGKETMLEDFGDNVELGVNVDALLGYAVLRNREIESDGLFGDEASSSSLDETATSSVGTPPHFVVDSDDHFVNKGDKVFHITVEYEDEHHYKSLEKKEAQRRKKKLPVKREFSQPMSIQEMIDMGFMDDIVVDGLRSHEYHSVIVTEVDPRTKETICIIEYKNCFMEESIWKMKEEFEAELAIEMEKFKQTKRSKKTVDELHVFKEALVEILRDDGVRMLAYYGGTKQLVCSSAASSDFLDKYFVRTHDVLCSPLTAIDFACSKMKSYVHHMLFARPLADGPTDFSVMHRQKPHMAGSGLNFQVKFRGEEEPVYGIVFVYVPINVVQGHEDTETTAPLCVPLHPQAHCGHIVVTEDGKFRLQTAIISNDHGDTVSTNLLHTAGTEDDTKSQDLSILASWDMVAGHFNGD